MACRSSAGVTPSRAPTRIESNLPRLRVSACAWGRSKIAAVAPPSDSTEPNVAVPTIVNRCDTPWVDTPIFSPTASCSFLAVAADRLAVVADKPDLVRDVAGGDADLRNGAHVGEHGGRKRRALAARLIA